MPKFHIYNIVSDVVMNNFIERLSSIPNGNKYFFMHSLLTHVPIVFDRNGELLPPQKWGLGGFRNLKGQTNTIESRLNDYRMHFEQVLYAESKIRQIVNVTSTNRALKNATIIVHSDHGSRISIGDYKDKNIPNYTTVDYESDMRNSFFAVKIAGLKGEVVVNPVRIDNLLKNLVENHFQSVDVDALSTPDDPNYPQNMVSR